jgi:hypothetical protein
MVSEHLHKMEFIGDKKTLKDGLLYPTGLLRKDFGKEKGD